MCDENPSSRQLDIQFSKVDGAFAVLDSASAAWAQVCPMTNASAKFVRVLAQAKPRFDCCLSSYRSCQSVQPLYCHTVDGLCSALVDGAITVTLGQCGAFGALLLSIAMSVLVTVVLGPDLRRHGASSHLSIQRSQEERPCEWNASRTTPPTSWHRTEGHQEPLIVRPGASDSMTH